MGFIQAENLRPSDPSGNLHFNENQISRPSCRSLRCGIVVFRMHRNTKLSIHRTDFLRTQRRVAAVAGDGGFAHSDLPVEAERPCASGWSCHLEHRREREFRSRILSQDEHFRRALSTRAAVGCRACVLLVGKIFRRGNLGHDGLHARHYASHTRGRSRIVVQDERNSF